MPRGSLGLIVGLVLGLVVVFANFGYMLIVALFGAVGYAVHKALDGDLDLSRILGGRGRS